MKTLLLLIFGAISFTFTHGQSADQWLVARYKMDQHESDSSPNKNDGQMQGNIQSTTDRFGNPCGALHFDGSSAYITVPNSPSLQSPASAISVTVWFRLDSDGLGNRNVVILSKGDHPAQYRAALTQQFAQGKSIISLSDSLTGPDKDYGTHLLDVGKWYFLALTYGDSWMHAYLNGKLIWQRHDFALLTPNDHPLEIGRDLSSATPYFKGSMDDLRIYDYALPIRQVEEMYADNSDSLMENNFSMRMPRNIELNTERGQCYATVHYAMPRVELSCGSYELKQLSSQFPDAKFPPGDHVIAFEATSAAQSIRDSFHIAVYDRDAPYLQCPSDINLKSTDGNPVVVNYPEVKMNDNCPNAHMKRTEGQASGSKFAVGTTAVTYTATDASGNVSHCTFHVTVERSAPIAPPAKTESKPAKPDKDVVVIGQVPESKPDHKAAEKELDELCQTDIFKSNDPGKCGAVVHYQAPTIHNANKAKTIQISGLASGSLFPVGNTVNKFAIAAPDGQKRDCFFTVHIKDTEAPKVTCPPDSFIILNPGRRGVTFYYHKPVVDDNCPVDTIIQTEGSTSGCFLSVGQHPFAFDIHTRSGEVQHCSFTVTVQSGPVTNNGVAPSFINENLNIGADTIHYEYKMETKNCMLTAYMYDDGEEDGDSVSIIFNDHIIVDHEMIYLKEHHVIKRFITLTSGQENYLIAKAWNTGRVGLNTLRIDIYEGYIENDKRDLRGKKTVFTKILHSRPGDASGILMKCKW